MDAEVFKEYLVALGWKVDYAGLRRFDEAVRRAGSAVESITGGMAKTAALAGTSVVTSLTGIATAAFGLMANVANADLSFQMFARRMYLGADQARHMKIALDALGVSAEDVIFGPPELAERYKALDDLQSKIEREFGGTGEMEKRLKQFRDIEFMFIKFKVALNLLARAGTASVVQKLFGDGKVQERLEHWLGYFIQNMPRLVGQLTDNLVPVLRDVYAIWQDMVSVGRDLTSAFLRIVGDLYDDQKLKNGAVNIENVGLAIHHVADSTKTLFDYLKRVADYIAANPLLARIFGQAAAGGIVAGPLGALGGATEPLIERGYEKFVYPHTREARIQQYAGLTAGIAAQYGVPTDIAEALVMEESRFDPLARSKKGALGLTQLMPGTAAGLGVNNPLDPSQNLNAGFKYLASLYKKYGNWTQALEAYNEGPGRLDSGVVYSDATKYAQDILSGAKGYGAGGLGSTINVGGITVNVQYPNATPEQIGKAVTDAIEDKLGKQTQRNMLQLSGVYAH